MQHRKKARAEQRQRSGGAGSWAIEVHTLAPQEMGAYQARRAGERPLMPRGDMTRSRCGTVRPRRGNQIVGRKLSPNQ